MPESQHQVRFPILAPPRPTTVHEVASASDPGRRLRRNDDAVSVFGLSLPQDDLDIVVLSVADGLGEHARGSGASAVAVEAFGDALNGLVGSLLIGPRWQYGLAEIVDTAIAETNARVRAMKPSAKGQSAATTLTVAILAGDWLCAAHLGNSRVYRLSRNQLEQLTEDHAREPLALLTPPREDMLTADDNGRLASALGVTDSTTPSVMFRQIAPGDVVLVCSDGLHEQVEGDEIARLLNASGSLEDIAASLVSAANARGGDDNISVCLARVGKVASRLPEPDERAERLYGDVAATLLPRYQAEAPRQWLPDRIGLVVGLLLSLVVLGGFVFWDDYKARKVQATKAAEVAATAGAGATRTATGDTSWAGTAPPQPVAQVPVSQPGPVPVAIVRDSDRAVTTAPPPPPSAPQPAAKPVPAPATADSIAAAAALKREAAAALSREATKALRREAAQATVRRANDSLAEARMAAAEQDRRDSVALAVAAATRVAEQRARDSATAAERRKQDSIEARARIEAQARSAAQAEESRRQQDQLKQARLASGHVALNGWLTRVVAAVSAGEAGSAVLAAGPPSFREFVDRNGPKISDATMTNVEVDDASGEARAEWVLKWKSNFGTSTSKRMKAAATVVREGETWRLLGWKILEGAP